jgi:hypothetical protein
LGSLRTTGEQNRLHIKNIENERDKLASDLSLALGKCEDQQNEIRRLATELGERETCAKGAEEYVMTFVQ